MSPSSADMRRFVPSVVVVDPRFDAYKPLAASARLGKIDLHFCSSGREALKLARRLAVDAWLIAADLDDMAGHDLVPLLQARCDQAAGLSKMAFVGSPALAARAASVEPVLSQPISFAELEQLLGLPTAERARVVSQAAASGRGFAAIPVGVGAAVVAIAMLMMR